MQFHHQKDFFVRSATASDQGEILDLVRKFGGPAAAPEFVAALQSDFVKRVGDPTNLFKIALNSNGVIIGTLLCDPTEWKLLAVNPNFMKQEVKEVLLGEVKAWAAKSEGKLGLAAKLITGSWKAFIKSQGARIEKLNDGSEQIQF